MSTASTILKKTPPATVVSAGKMHKTVKVRMVKEEWNKRLRKYYHKSYQTLVRDPNSSLREGDTITLEPEVYTKHVRHVVSSLVSAFGTPASTRPPILSAAERAALREPKLEARVMRRAQRGVLSAIERAKERGRWGDEELLQAEKDTEGVKSDGLVVENVERGTDRVGRKSLPGGGHEFGKINEEASRGGQRVKKLARKAREHEGEQKAQAGRVTEEVARLTLERDTGRRVEDAEAR